MSRKNINFGDKKMKKSDFYKKTKNNQDRSHQCLEEPYGTKNSFKYFIGYIENDAIRPLCIKLPQITGYVRKFESNTTMSFKISDNQLLKKYNQTWKRVEKLLKIKFDSETVYGDKYIRNKNKNIC